jgi:hypothetical protein
MGVDNTLECFFNTKQSIYFTMELILGFYVRNVIVDEIDITEKLFQCFFIA